MISMGKIILIGTKQIYFLKINLQNLALKLHFLSISLIYLLT